MEVKAPQHRLDPRELGDPLQIGLVGAGKSQGRLDRGQGNNRR